MTDAPSPEGLDKVIHERARLGMMSALAARGRMTFGELKTLLAMTDGNLSVHARVLETEGYIEIKKSFVHRKPRTTMILTRKGRDAFRKYVDYLGRVIRMEGSG